MAVKGICISVEADDAGATSGNVSFRTDPLQVFMRGARWRSESGEWRARREEHWLIRFRER
jgi:hypothetical protein